MKVKIRIERRMKKHNEEHHNLYSSLYISWITKSMRLRWAGHFARMLEETRQTRRSYACYGEEKY
jgi:hypothetical protein